MLFEKTVSGLEQDMENSLSDYKAGEIKAVDCYNDLLRIERDMQDRLEKQSKSIKAAKAPLSYHYSTEKQTLGQLQVNRATALLGQPIELIKGELQEAVNSDKLDFAFSLIKQINKSEYTNAERQSLHRIYDQAIKKANLLDLHDQRERTKAALKVVRTTASKCGECTPDELIQLKNLEKSRQELVYVKQKTELPTLPVSVLIDKLD